MMAPCGAVFAARHADKIGQGYISREHTARLCLRRASRGGLKHAMLCTCTGSSNAVSPRPLSLPCWALALLIEAPQTQYEDTPGRVPAVTASGVRVVGVGWCIAGPPKERISPISTGNSGSCGRAPTATLGTKPLYVTTKKLLD